MKRFEYKLFEVKINPWTGKFNEEEFIKDLNKEGMQGWEISEKIAKPAGQMVILKREL